ncbi:hypothetical protein M5D96_012667, partial [Drosophila gunungcola]
LKTTEGQYRRVSKSRPGRTELATIALDYWSAGNLRISIIR